LTTFLPILIGLSHGVVNNAPGTQGLPGTGNTIDSIQRFGYPGDEGASEEDMPGEAPTIRHTVPTRRSVREVPGINDLTPSLGKPRSLQPGLLLDKIWVEDLP